MNINPIKILKSINFKSRSLQIAVILNVVGIVCVLWWYYSVVQNKYKEAETLSVEYKKKQNELNRIYAMKPQLKNLRLNVADLRARLDSLKSVFPDKKEVPKLIREITRVAQKAGISTSRFNPLPDVKKEHYIENSYSLFVTGGYHELANFFSYLAGFDLIINLTNVVIRRNPGLKTSFDEYEELGGTIKTISAKFNITTFSSKKLGAK